MDQAEMEKRCKEAIKQTGPETTGIIGGIVAGLIYDMRQWNIRGRAGETDEIQMDIGRCYAALKMLEEYIDADPAKIESGILDVLRYDV